MRWTGPPGPGIAGERAPPPGSGPSALDPEAARRARRGAVNHRAGASAEESVARAYLRAGCAILARRYRSGHGEVDLILRDGSTLVFVEVKKGRSHDAALARITPRQIDRIFAAATEYVAQEPQGQLTPMRFDAATVDAAGRVELHRGVLAHF